MALISRGRSRFPAPIAVRQCRGNSTGTRCHKRPAITFHFNQPLRHRERNTSRMMLREVANSSQSSPQPEVASQVRICRERSVYPANDNAIGFIESHGESLCSVCFLYFTPIDA